MVAQFLTVLDVPPVKAKLIVLLKPNYIVDVRWEKTDLPESFYYKLKVTSHLNHSCLSPQSPRLSQR